MVENNNTFNLDLKLHPFDEIWESHKDKLKANKIRLRWNIAIEKEKPKDPKNLTSIKEIWKYYINHGSYHGLRYWIDKQLLPFERILWVIVFLICFGYSIYVIFELYSNFKLRKSHIIIDEINHDFEKIIFPSVTVCPDTRVDWVKALEIADALIPKGNENAKKYFLDLLDKLSDIKITRLEKLKLNTNYSLDLQVFNGINITQVMLDVLPKCEDYIFNCSWNYAQQSCCDIFDLQRTSFGFCYTFNSMTSEKSNKSVSLDIKGAEAYGIRSGLKFSAVITNRSKLSRSMKVRFDKNPMPLMISDVHVLPFRSRYYAFGNWYYVSIKYTSSYPSEAVKDLAMEQNPPCRYDNNHEYKYQNCLMQCIRQYFIENCNCILTFFFPTPDNMQSRQCNIFDMQCIAATSFVEDTASIKKICDCPDECLYIKYDDFTGVVPNQYEDQMTVDIHFDGPTGVSYKREMVLSNVDLLVQLGGVFNLLVGGSAISIIEFLYSILLTIYAVYSKFFNFNKKGKKKIHPVIEVNPRHNIVD